uniref:(northern house mosquito) hypothetical protein n=1 Tax=Culex pipiens TaxID=7175 RepID=A0A8D8KLG6_CULPI
MSLLVDSVLTRLTVDEEEDEKEVEEQEEPKPIVVKPKTMVRSNPGQLQRDHCEAYDKPYVSSIRTHPNCGCNAGCVRSASFREEGLQHEAVHLPTDQKIVHPFNYCGKNKLAKVQGPHQGGLQQ